MTMENSIQLLQTIMIVVYMGISTYFDYKWKRIPWWVQGMGTIFVCIYLIVKGNTPGIELFISLIPGMIMIFLSFITRESIGYGDGLSVMIIGSIMGIKNCFWMICISLVMISLVSAILMILKRASQKTKIPYVPFLFAAESLMLIGAIL